jgi:uncharacterized protein (DUF1330 family)
MQGSRTWLFAITVVFVLAPSWPVKADEAHPDAVPAYYIADFEVADRKAIKPYSEKVEATFQPFGGRFIVRGADPLPLEGQQPKGRLVIIQFDSMERAQAWYNSPGYSELRPIRQKAGKSNVYILQGLAQ